MPLSYISILLMLFSKSLMSSFEFLKSNFISEGIIQAPSSFKNINHYKEEQFLSKSKKPSVAIIYFNIEQARLFNRIFNRYSIEFKHLNLYFFGQLTLSDGTSLDAIYNLLTSHRTYPVFIDFRAEPTYLKPSMNAVSFITPIINLNISKNLLQLSSGIYSSVLAYQSYFVSKQSEIILEEHNIETKRLGLLRSKLESIEPIIRRAEDIFIDMAALKYSECPSTFSPNPSGLYLEELCRISRYAGLNEQLKMLYIYGVCPPNHNDQQDVVSANAMAQVLWYFLDGLNARLNDYPISSAHLKEFVISLKDLNLSFSFWKSTLSGRWWVQIPDAATHTETLYPCSYEDYVSTSEGKIPQLLLKILDFN